MNLRQSYEQLITEKLRKLPVPDADASWQQMKRLLDEDDKTTAGGKRPPGNSGGWWRLGVIAVIVSASLWLYVEKTTAAGTNSVAKEKSTKSINPQTKAIDKNTTLPGAVSGTTLPNKTTDQPALAVRDGSAEPAAAAVTSQSAPSQYINGTRQAAGKTNSVADKSHEQETANTILPAVTHRGRMRHDPAQSAGNTSAAQTAAGSEEMNGKGKLDNALAGTTEKIGAPVHQNNMPAGHPYLSAGNKDANSGSFAAGQHPQTGNGDWLAALEEVKIPATIPSANTSLAAGDSISNGNDRVPSFSNETKKSIAKAKRDKEVEELTRKEKKSFHLDLSNVFKPFSLHTDPEPRWAAGIAISSTVPLNAQSRFNYNINAKSGMLTDYIPSVYLQFHLNNYVYAQTELNFVSPQFTPQLLISRQTYGAAQPTGTSQQQSIYVQKIYYFSVPVSLHYSPINNLYFSAGLQFSSFQSGLATIQQKQYSTLSGPDHPDNVNNTVLKFKDDSIAAKIYPNEWRWQAGAEYYWNRFTVGLRYNRSFKNVLNPETASALPVNGLRNESLILSLRYNLFESRKKN